MADPVTLFSAAMTTMQFVLQLKNYIQDKKKRKQEKLQLQAAGSLLLPPPVYNYCVSYHVYPAASHPSSAYPGPYNYNQILQPSSSYTSAGAVPLPCAEPPPWCPPPHLSYDWRGLLGGRMEFLKHQKAPNNLHRRQALWSLHKSMRTGSCALSDRASSYQHWESLQPELIGSPATSVLQSTIAVVDLSSGKIDMFVEKEGTYYRDYRINGCDAAVFEHLFRNNLVFKGEIHDQKLQSVSKEVSMVEIGIPAGVQSTNSWMSLGIYEDGVEEVVNDGTTFVEIVRGAVFGLVCGLYKDPSHINVEMEPAHINGHVEIIRVTAGGHVMRTAIFGRRPHLPKRHQCLFSVFSFGDDGGWAAEDVLLG